MADTDPDLQDLHLGDVRSGLRRDAGPETSNLDDLSWENPYDMAKGHRGFMAGDMIMAMYGWTPNWKALTDGHSIVNLYVRRSFDGGQTWSTLPGSFTHTNDITYSGDGTTTCEWQGPISDQVPVCTHLRRRRLRAGQERLAAARLAGDGPRPEVLADDPKHHRGLGEHRLAAGGLHCAGVRRRHPRSLALLHGLRDRLDQRLRRRRGDAARPVLQPRHRVGRRVPGVAGRGDRSGLPAVGRQRRRVRSQRLLQRVRRPRGQQALRVGRGRRHRSPGGQFFYAVWNQWTSTSTGHEIASDAWFRRVAFLDDYVPDEEDPSGPGTTDVDQDLYIADWDGGNDCNDNDPSINPGAPEICDDLTDNNCDGFIDEDCGGGTCDPAGTPCTSATADLCCSGSCHPKWRTCR